MVEKPRSEVPQLDTSNVTYCELSDCGEMFGVRLDNGARAQAELIQTPIGVQLNLQFTNHARLEGRRQLWIRMESDSGAFIEAASTWIDLGPKGRTTAEFLITGTKAEIEASKLLLGY